MSKLLLTETEKNEILSMYYSSNNVILEKKGGRRLAKQFAEYLNGRGYGRNTFSVNDLGKILETHQSYYKIVGTGDNARAVLTDDFTDFTNFLDTFFRNASEKDIYQFFLVNDPEWAMKSIFSSIRDIASNPSDSKLLNLETIIRGLQGNEVFASAKYENLNQKLNDLLKVLDSDNYKSKKSTANRANLLNNLVPVLPDSLKGQVVDFLTGRQIRRLYRILTTWGKDLDVLKSEFNKLVNNPKDMDKHRLAEKIIDTLDSIEATQNAEARSMYEALMENDEVPSSLKQVLRTMTENEQKLFLWDEVTSSRVGREILGGLSDEAARWKENIKFWKMFSKKAPYIDGRYLKKVIGAYISYGFNAHMVTFKNLNDAMVKSSSRTVGSLRTLLRTALSKIISPVLVGTLSALFEIGKYVYNSTAFDWIKSLVGDDYDSEYEYSTAGLVSFMLNKWSEEWDSRFNNKDTGFIPDWSPVLGGPFTEFAVKLNKRELGKDEEYLDGVDDDTPIAVPEAEVIAYEDNTRSFRKFVIDKIMEEDKIKQIGKNDEYYFVIGKDDNVKQWYKFSDNTFGRE